MKKELFEKFVTFVSLQERVEDLKKDILPFVTNFAGKIDAYRYSSLNQFRHFPNKYNDESINEIIITTEKIIFLWEEYNCGEADNYGLEFPTEYLFLDDAEWKYKEEADKIDRQEKNKLKNEKLKQESIERIRQAEEVEYERLKIKLKK